MITDYLSVDVKKDKRDINMIKLLTMYIQWTLIFSDEKLLQFQSDIMTEYWKFPQMPEQFIYKVLKILNKLIKRMIDMLSGHDDFYLLYYMVDFY